MKSDAKLGLIAGLVAVIMVAVIYYYKPDGPERVVPVSTKAPTSAPVTPIASLLLPPSKMAPSDSSVDLD